jgi:hypothetical protein
LTTRGKVKIEPRHKCFFWKGIDMSKIFNITTGEMVYDSTLEDAKRTMRHNRKSRVLGNHPSVDIRSSDTEDMVRGVNPIFDIWNAGMSQAGCYVRGDGEFRIDAKEEHERVLAEIRALSRRVKLVA